MSRSRSRVGRVVESSVSRLYVVSQFSSCGFVTWCHEHSKLVSSSVGWFGSLLVVGW
ncbi:hypothetical protein ACXZ9C_11240 [Streptococcus agalactiae]